MNKDHIYFLGIGGIGMSAIARYFLREGRKVAGYDRTRTPLTERLADEGALVHYDDDTELIPDGFRDPSRTLVVYTPAVPDAHSELNWFRKGGFEILKRSEMLGRIADGKYVMAVAGTHGKTTTTTMTAWLNHVAGGGNAGGAGGGKGGSAFLGGISKNFDSNLVTGGGERLAVEADEFDRSFLQLYPDAAVITSADADHLDVYGTRERLREAFEQFVKQIKKGGALVIHEGVDIPASNDGIEIYSYSFGGESDFSAVNPRVMPDGTYMFDLLCPDRTVKDCRLGIPGKINVENAVAASALLWVAAKKGVDGTSFDEGKLREGLATFAGVRRRFDFHINTPELGYMDDYAHHPEELRAAIGSLREMFPGRKLTAVFQPHLYTRTRDFHREFARALSMADEVILLPVYPAREEPIEGVGSEMIAEQVTVPHRVVPLEKVAQEIERSAVDMLATFGAGNIENYTGDIAQRLAARVAKQSPETI